MDTTGTTALISQIPDAVAKAATEAFEGLAEKLSSIGDPPSEEPKSWFIDPFTMLDSMGVGYRMAPTSLTFETLRTASEKDTAIAAIIITRVNQMSAFARRQANKYSMGHIVTLRGAEPNRRFTPSEKEKIDFIERFLLDTGMDFNIERDNFTDFLKKIVRDRLTYDAASFEKTPTFGGGIHSFHAVDGSTIRIANPKVAKGTPPDVAEIKEQIRYVQFINAQKVGEYTAHELAYLVSNPRTNIKVYRYGFPEIEMLMTTITAHLWAEEFNRRNFSQGSTVKGVLNLKGKIPPVQLDLMRKQWMAQISGVSNAWKTPLVNSDGVEFIPLQLNNQEMGYQAWMEYLMKMACAIYMIDPAEINFDLRAGSGGQQPMFMSNNEAQQKVSKDRGLQPLIRFIEDGINRHLVWPIDPRFEIRLLGLDAKTEEQAAQLRIQQGQSFMKLNEVRALEDLPPDPDGDVILNPVYIQNIQFKETMAFQKQQAAQAAGADPNKPQAPAEEDKAFLSKPGDEERQAAGRLLQFGNREDDAKSDEEDDPGPTDETVRKLVRDDWVSSVHASVKPGDLRKSEKEKLFEILDLD